MRMFSVAALACVLALVVSGSMRAENAKAEVEKISEQYDGALLNFDPAFLKNVFDDDAVFIDEAGKVSDKSQNLASFGSTKYESAKTTNRSFRVIGDSVIEVGIWEATGTKDGIRFAWRNRYCDIWTKKGEKWVITFEQATPMVLEGPGDATLTKELDAALEAWLTAFNRHDAKVLAAEYAEDADLRSETGEKVLGREAVEKMFAERFTKNPNVRTKLSDVSRKVLGADIVVEDGTWEESGHSEPGQPTQGQYSTTLVRRNGKWLAVHERNFNMK